MKRPIALIIGIIVLVFSFIGFSSYFKKHPLKIGKKTNNEKILLKEEYLICSKETSERKEVLYIEFKNGVVSNTAINQITASIDLAKYSKDEYDKQIDSLCSKTPDENSNHLFDCNVMWNLKSVNIIGKINIPEDYRGLDKESIKTKIQEEKNATCQNTSSIPKLVTGSNPVINQAITDNRYIIKKKVITEDETNTTNEGIKKRNSHEVFCLDWNASGGSDVSMSYDFYCDKNVVQKYVDVKISAKFNENNLFGKNSGKYTVADAEKEFRNRYCSKVSDCDISWDEYKTYITLKGTCKSNYAGLPKSTVEEFRNDWEITTALNEICE